MNNDNEVEDYFKNENQYLSLISITNSTMDSYVKFNQEFLLQLENLKKVSNLIESNLTNSNKIDDKIIDNTSTNLNLNQADDEVIKSNNSLNEETESISNLENVEKKEQSPIKVTTPTNQTELTNSRKEFHKNCTKSSDKNEMIIEDKMPMGSRSGLKESAPRDKSNYGSMSKRQKIENSENDKYQVLIND